jgi:SAM-dependent methyltransferase
MTEMASAGFSAPRPITNAEECEFYHTMEIPGLGMVHGLWDLRPIVDKYLGEVSFSNKRVLEIGPASGFLTFEMEKRGASVVAVEMTDDTGCDYVPFPASVLDRFYGPRAHFMNRIKNSFWFTHAAHQSRAQMLYGNAYNLPDWLGLFDIAILGAVLLHCHSPLQIVEQCARRAKTLVIADAFFPGLEGSPVCQLVPNRALEVHCDYWWRFSTDLFTQFLGIMDFSCRTSTYADERGIPLFTIVGTKDEAEAARQRALQAEAALSACKASAEATEQRALQMKIENETLRAECTALREECHRLADAAAKWFDATVAVTTEDDPFAGTRRLNVRLWKRSNGRSPVELADRASEAGRWELAVRYYRDALNLRPSDSTIWRQYGRSLNQTGKTAEAAIAYKKAAELDRAAGAPDPEAQVALAASTGGEGRGAGPGDLLTKS